VNAECDPKEDGCSQEKELVCDAASYKCKYASSLLGDTDQSTKPQTDATVGTLDVNAKCDPKEDGCSQEKELVCDTASYECRYASSLLGDTDQSTKSKTGATVGGVCGGLLLIVVIAAAWRHMSTRERPRTATLSSFTLNPQATAAASAPAPRVANLAEDEKGYAVAVTSNPGYNYPAPVRSAEGAYEEVEDPYENMSDGDLDV
jgi:hypothetical protein